MSTTSDNNIPARSRPPSAVKRIAGYDIAGIEIDFVSTFPQRIAQALLDQGVPHSLVGDWLEELGHSLVGSAVFVRAQAD